MLRPHLRAPRRTAALATLLFLMTAGCGGQAATTAPGTTTYGGPGTTALTASIGVQDYLFAPSVDSVKVGTTVKWTNGGTLPHTVTSDASIWDSGQLVSPSSGGVDPYGGGGMTVGGTYQRSFASPGTYTYHCANHPGMMGTIVVTP
jgi:plastocyanin